MHFTSPSKCVPKSRYRRCTAYLITSVLQWRARDGKLFRVFTKPDYRLGGSENKIESGAQQRPSSAATKTKETRVDRESKATAGDTDTQRRKEIAKAQSKGKKKRSGSSGAVVGEKRGGRAARSMQDGRTRVKKMNLSSARVSLQSLLDEEDDDDED